MVNPVLRGPLGPAMQSRGKSVPCATTGGRGYQGKGHGLLGGPREAEACTAREGQEGD